MLLYVLNLEGKSIKHEEYIKLHSHYSYLIMLLLENLILVEELTQKIKLMNSHSMNKREFLKQMKNVNY